MAEQPATASPRWPYVFASGLAMGSADVVPGVSGGTMAFILGIYGQLLEAITGFDLELLALLRRGDWSAAAARIHLGFLVPLLTGLFGSVLLLVRPITWLYEHQP
ncbi:MAG: undecaprenyl phosphate translocase family protein, partial [Vulcanococcus sp.]